MPANLPFLTADDGRLLFEKATRVVYRGDEVIVAEGSRRRALFVLRSGSVRVERHDLGGSTTLASLEPGEVFGEMSFVEDTGASATVVAEGDVEVDVIEGEVVHALLFSVPGLAARFFHSLAVTLSRRLRDTSGPG